jgi:cystathionine beta-lyase
MVEAGGDPAKGIVPLSVADMEFVEAPEIVEALRSFASDAVFGYTEPTDSYYDACISWQTRRHGWTPSRDWMVLSPGVVPALFNAVKCLTEPGDAIIIQPPVYYPFRWAAERTGRDVIENPLILDGDNRYLIDFDDLAEKAADPQARMLILCSPHNPVGRVWDREELRRLVDICLENDVFIVSDEIHDGLIMPGYHHTTLMNVMTPDEWDRCMVCTAPSKTFNLAGCQCSNIFIPSGDVRERFEHGFGMSAIESLNCFSYVACTAAYESCDAWLDELIDVIWTNHELVADRLSSFRPEATVFDLEGTYLQWVDLRCLGLDADRLESLMHEADLYLDEGHLFGREGDGFERINLACPTSVIEESLDRLQHVLTI